MHPVFPLPEITYPLHLDTVGKLLALGYGMTAYCDTLYCHHRSKVNLYRLAQRIGRDHSSMHDDIVGYFHCSECRKAGRPDRNISFRLGCCSYPHSNVGSRHSTLVQTGGRGS